MFIFYAIDCFKGNVSAQPNFWMADKLQMNYDVSKNAYDINERSDLGYLRPCCGTENAFVAPDASM
jgi:hypothetical protein